ncbi:MAG: hypothetical protein U5J83_01015 [Bryobacterales bacterium]|nr:hypothetical protein [Bryobacterales bacterium]
MDANEGVPAYDETQEYVSTIMKRVFEDQPKRGGASMRAPAKIAPIPPLSAPSGNGTAGAGLVSPAKSPNQ